MSISYSEKLRDPRWQRKRLECLQAAEWTCQLCAASDRPLHVHHKQYFKGREPWEYDSDQLAVLCDECHDAQHESEDRLLVVASRAPVDGPASRAECACMLEGFIGVETNLEFAYELRLRILGALGALAPYGDAAQVERLNKDVFSADSRVLRVIRDVMGEPDKLRGIKL